MVSTIYTIGRFVKYLLLISIIFFAMVDNTKILEFGFVTLSTIGFGFIRTYPFANMNPSDTDSKNITTIVSIDPSIIDTDLTATEKIIRALVGS